MCGRFVQSASADDYARYFGADIVKTEHLVANYNVAPTDRVYAVAEHEDDRIVGSFSWGLVPHWSKDRRQAARFINAREETLVEKPAFRDSFKTRRCIIPADGFYEWTRRGDLKIPHLIFIGTHAPMALAGNTGAAVAAINDILLDGEETDPTDDRNAMAGNHLPTKHLTAFYRVRNKVHGDLAICTARTCWRTLPGWARCGTTPTCANQALNLSDLGARCAAGG